jgi:hypothetical protein
MASGFISTEETESGNLSPSSIVGNVEIPTWGAVMNDGVMDGNSTFGKKDSAIAVTGEVIMRLTTLGVLSSVLARLG